MHAAFLIYLNARRAAVFTERAAEMHGIWEQLEKGWAAGMKPKRHFLDEHLLGNGVKNTSGDSGFVPISCRRVCVAFP